MKRQGMTAAVLAAVFFLGGCYLPARFDAEVEVTRAGYYSMAFDGYMVYVPLYQDIRAAKLTPSQEREKIERVRTDFTRDSAVKEFSYYQKGAFKVAYRKSGDLLRYGRVVFVRPNNPVLTAEYDRQDKVVTVRGAYVKKEDREKLIAEGLSMEGELRVRTDAKVIGHNAATVRKDGTSDVYTWRIRSIEDPPPKIEIALR
jgi:hypothetical protein